MVELNPRELSVDPDSPEDKVYDEETNTYAYEEVVGDLSKNNRFTDQDLRFGGIIPYENMEMGKNLF